MIGLLEVRGFGRVRLVVDVPALYFCVPLKNWGEIVELRRRDGARSSDEKGGSACCGAGDAWLTVMFIAWGCKAVRGRDVFLVVVHKSMSQPKSGRV